MFNYNINLKSAGKEEDVWWLCKQVRSTLDNSLAIAAPASAAFFMSIFFNVMHVIKS
jgi:hypothetical protein